MAQINYVKKITAVVFIVFAIFAYKAVQADTYPDDSCISGTGCNNCNACGCGAGGCMGPFGCSAYPAPYCAPTTCQTPGDFCYGQATCCPFNKCDDPDDACYGQATCCGSSGGFTHKECKNAACTVVNGKAEDQCTRTNFSDGSILDTCGTGTGDWYLTCINNTCSLASGSNSSNCSVQGSPCGLASHKACVNNSCVTVSGSGLDQCTTSSCGGSFTHLECVNSACVSVLGAGSNGCSTAGSYCTATPGSPSHKACVNGSCSLIMNSGTDECTTTGAACSGSFISRTCINGTCVASYSFFEGNSCGTVGQSCTPAVCGNGTCEDGEDSNNCAQDCGGTGTGYCGDNACNNGETCGTCSQDCGVCTGNITGTSCGPDGTYVGCYTDSSSRALPVQLTNGGSTREGCVALAKNAGYKYAGLQYGGQCFAGNTLGYNQVSDSECNMPCDANNSQNCGGSWRNSICSISSGGGSACTTPGPGTNQMVGCLFNDSNLSSVYGNAPSESVSGNVADNFTAVNEVNWGYGGPSGLSDNFSIRWQGNFTFSGGTYRFKVDNNDDGYRVYVDGNPILDYWLPTCCNRRQNGQPDTTDVVLSQGQHTIKFEYNEYSGGAVANLSWAFLAPLPPPAISLAPTSFTFAAPINTAPATQSITVGNTGTGQLNWNASTDQTWCHVGTTSGTVAPGGNSGAINVYMDAQSTSGYRNCTITVSGNNTSSKTATVSYLSYGPPVVQVDRPAPNSTVSGTTTISGYAIPDFGRTLYVELWMASTPTLVVTSQAGQPKYSATFYGGAYASACTGTNAGKPNCPNVGFTYDMDTTKYSNGPHTITVKAIDDVGNTTIVDVPFVINNIGDPDGGPGGTITVSNSTCGRIDLSWTAGTNATGYNVFRNTANDSSTATQIVTNTSALSYADTAVTPNTVYYYWVQSVGSPNKVPGSIHPIAPKSCSPVTSNITASNTGLCEAVRLTWAASSGATGYFVYRNTSNTLTGATKINAGNVTTYIDSSVPVTGASQNYYYWVSANNGGGEDVPNQALAMPIAVVSCTANLSGSDKDISSFTDTNNHTTNNSTGDCDGFNLPSSTTAIRSGYTISFTINLCNSSSFQDATNVVITDQMTNLNKPSGGWQMQYQDSNGVWQTFPSSGIVENLSDPNNPSLTLTFPAAFKVPKATSGTQIRKLTFKAVTAPISGSISTGRFRNRSVINYNVKAGVAGTPVVASTAYVLYYNSSTSVPDRKETQPN